MATVLIRKGKYQHKVAGREPERKIYGVYMRSVLDEKVTLSITEIGRNIKSNLEAKIISKIAGKCITEGYIKPNSIKVINYSSGMIIAEHIEFHAVFECMICLPVEGMLIECTCKTITKAGIHSEVLDDEENIPVTIFIARDHHYLDNRFDTIAVGQKLTVRVIGIRYELNDPYICAIAKLADLSDMSSGSSAPRKHPKISVLGEMYGGGNVEIEPDNA
jgi:DNA-directed RNA polymerase subunit E'/Rpb7